MCAWPISFLLFCGLLLITDYFQMIDAFKNPPYGQLAVSGKNLVEKSTNNPVVLRGLSMYWSQWVPKYWTAETIKKLKCSCNANVVRAAMATEYNGYLQNPTVEYNKMKVLIEAAINEGIYIVVDWHTGEDLATNQIEQAKEFFTKIAQNYGSNPHILYEIWNEPNKYVTWEAVIKPYSKTLVDVIRQYDKNNVIIVGTPNWSQDVDLVAKNPLSGYTNIVYSLHFYAGSHEEFLRKKIKAAYELGLPMFVTEYGCWSEPYNEWKNFNELEKYYPILDSMGISYTAWHVADIDEQSSIMTKGTEIKDICNPAYLTSYGKKIIGNLLYKNAGTGLYC
uniref:Putative effector protein n=1 Tax=Heterodera avenae TaxID=34510 RepID=A0A2L0VDM0_HETAV|nr:putative effector protein [Heterodera avenae]